MWFEAGEKVVFFSVVALAAALGGIAKAKTRASGCLPHIEAVGVGSTARAAADRARGEVAARVRSTIQVEADRIVEDTRGSDGEHFVERFVERVHVEHAFTHAELIEVAVEATDSGFRATARLDRAAAVERLSSAWARERALLLARVGLLEASRVRGGFGCPPEDAAQIEARVDRVMRAEFDRAALACRPVEMSAWVDAARALDAWVEHRRVTPWVWRGPPEWRPRAADAWGTAGAGSVVEASAVKSGAVAPSASLAVEVGTQVDEWGVHWAEARARLALRGADGEVSHGPVVWAARQPGADAQQAVGRARALLEARAAQPLAEAAASVMCRAVAGSPDPARRVGPTATALVGAPASPVARGIRAAVVAHPALQLEPGPVRLVLAARSTIDDVGVRRTEVVAFDGERGAVIGRAEHGCCGCTAAQHARGVAALPGRAIDRPVVAPKVALWWAADRAWAVEGSDDPARVEVEDAVRRGGGRVEAGAEQTIAVASGCVDEGRDSTGRVVRVGCRVELVVGRGAQVVVRRPGFGRTVEGARRRGSASALRVAIERLAMRCVGSSSDPTRRAMGETHAVDATGSTVIEESTQ